MKSKMRKILIVLMAVLLIVTSLVGCSAKGKKLMSVEGNKITENMVLLLMSRMKGTLSASGYGTKVDTSSFWDTVMDAKTGQTYDDYYTDLVLDSAKTYLAAMALFDELGLKLPDSYIDEIDAGMDDLIVSLGEGSKTYLNTQLAEYGANYDVLRETYIMEAKIAYLSDHLFGSDGSKISEENYENYYQENYVKFKHIFFYTTKPVYDTDENGDTIYYKDLTADPVRIAYKTTGDDVEPLLDSNGANVKDKNGDKIYVYKESQKIAYDEGTEDAPTYPNPVLDDNGYTVTEKLTAEESRELSDRVQMIMDAVKDGEYSLFDSYVEEYNEDIGMEMYPGGYYLTATSNYDSVEVRDALFEMEDGEIRRIESDYGIHIVMKYELDKGAYADTANKDFFRNESGTLTFLETLKNQLIGTYVEKYKADIKLNDKLVAGLSMKNVKANRYY